MPSGSKLGGAARVPKVKLHRHEFHSDLLNFIRVCMNLFMLAGFAKTTPKTALYSYFFKRFSIGKQTYSMHV
jgi:hypothetical protein